MVPAIGPAGTTTLESVREFGDESVGEKLERVRRAEKKAGRAPGSVSFSTTIVNHAMTSSALETKTMAENPSAVFGLSPERILRHPVVLIGTADEMEAELRRRENMHGLSLLAVNFSTASQIEAFGREVLPRFR